MLVKQVFIFYIKHCENCENQNYFGNRTEPPLVSTQIYFNLALDYFKPPQKINYSQKKGYSRPRISDFLSVWGGGLK